MTDGRTRVVAAGAAAVIALAYLVPFRDYGLNLDDEGALLYQIQRVVAGEVPYVDFTTGYTPGFFYLGAAAWRLAGDLPTFRLLLALLHAATVAGLVLLTARVATPLLAVTVAILMLVFIPVYPGEFCAFNTPYPAWVATAAWVGMALAMTSFVARRRRVWLLLAGLAAAAAFAIKPNAGVFAIAAASAVLLMLATPADGGRAGSVILWYALWLGILGGSWATFGFRPYLRDAVAYLVLLTAAMLALPTRARTHRRALAGDVAVLLGSFVAATVPWAVFFWARLGIEGILRDVLLLGSGAAALYYKPYPPFEPWALLVTALVGAAALAGAGMRAGWFRPSWVGLAAAAGLLSSVLAVSRLGLMPERTLWSVIWQLESAGFPLTLATQAGGVVWLWRRRQGNGGELPATLLLCGLFMHLQLYPRPDFMHLVAAAPLTAAFGAFLLERVLDWWASGFRRAGAPGLARAALPVTIALLMVLSLVRVSPSVAALQAGPRLRLPFAIAPVGVEEARGADIAAVGAAATRLASEVPRGAPSLAFPAADVVLFLAGSRNPTPYAYFFPGRPDHREEAEVVDALAAAPPRALVSLNRGLTFFDEAPSYYFLLRRFARARYGLLERHGRFDVLGLGAGEPSAATRADRRDDRVEAAGGGARLAELAARPVADAAPALLDVATGDDVVLRRAALTVLSDRLASAPERGLEEYVAAAGLDRRREVLLLRTIRDLREARAASYLFAAAARPDARVADEALGAMYVLRAELIARRHLWAGAETPAVWPGREALVRAVRAALGDRGAPARATALAAHLAGVLGEREMVPLLRARLGAEAAIAASAADALAALAPAGLACELTPLLARPELETVALVPSVLIGLAEQAEPVRTEARDCLARAMAAPGAPREPALWIAAALGDGRFTPVLRAALTADAVGVRRAAAWALGELPADAASAADLARAAAGDVDAVVRRLATGAAAKHAGNAPRAGLGPEPSASLGSRG